MHLQRPSYQPVIWIVLFIAGFLTAPLRAVPVGVLSYDTFIPGTPGSPGVDAFDFSNFTGAFALPPSFPVDDPLMFQSASLSLFQSTGLWRTFALGGIGPGFALDAFGNPLVQVPDNIVFTSAEFTATLSPLTFVLADGSTFTAGSSRIDVFLLPSGGNGLAADVDQAVISVQPTPEPATLFPTVSAIALFAWIVRSRKAKGARNDNSSCSH